MRVAFTLIATVSLFGSLSAPSARADVPAWTDDAPFEAFCAGLTKDAGCPECVCEVITQSNPTEDVGEISDIPTALVVRVTGVRDDGTIVSQFRAILGQEGKLADAGVLADASGHMGNPREGAVEILGSAQRFDMCPGMCPHDPVGIVHAFEVKTTWSEPTEKDPTVSNTESRTDLALCFAADGKDAGCWLLPLSAAKGTAKEDGPSKEKSVWSRSWKLSESGQVELTLGKAKGKAPAPVAKAAKLAKTFLKDVPGRPDATPATR